MQKARRFEKQSLALWIREKIAELEKDRKWNVLGFRENKEKCRVVLQHGAEAPVAVWATKGLQKKLRECEKSLRSEARGCGVLF